VGRGCIDIRDGGTRYVEYRLVVGEDLYWYRRRILLRKADEKIFLVLLVDGSAGQAVLSSYRDGKAAELGRGSVAIGREWEKFAVVAKGPSLTVLFDDAKVFEATDPKPVTGKTGLVAAGPGDASFDEFILETADTAPKP